MQQAIEEQRAEHAALVARSQHLEEEEGQRLRQKEALFDKVIDDQERGRKEARLLRQILDNEGAELSEHRERVLEMEHDVANYIVDWIRKVRVRVRRGRRRCGR